MDERQMRGLRFQLSWGIGGGGGHGAVDAWETVEARLRESAFHNGDVTLDLIVADDEFSRSLQVQTSAGRSNLMFGVEDESDYNVRTFGGGAVSEQQVEIGGYLWDSRSICDDFNFVIACFREFFETRDISRSKLD